MKKLKKILKTTTLALACILSIVIVAGLGFYYVKTKTSALDTTKLESSKTTSTFQILDTNGNQIKPSTENYISIKKLSSHTKNAFISAEDKRFYTHNGLDYIRIGGAIISNIRSRSFSQGASTISQQLIKNTHLSSEKTISRKLKEIKLTKALESKYTKDQILEFYLNNIYFGNGAYGIENASIHYFGKSASNLTLAESALLAGTINAPSFYDIEKRQDNALKRRNLILDLMQKYGKISKDDSSIAKAEPITLNLTKVSNNYLFDETIKEACKITNLTETMLKNSNLKIYTDIDLSLNKFIDSRIQNNYNNLESNPKVACIVIDNKTSQITAMSGSKQLLSSNISAGSALKPILVFAPAIEENQISPATKILDEKINISGYSPDNADKQFHGYVSVRESLSKSYNIPAVKILQELGTNKAINFAKKLNINLTDTDNNLSIALGSISNGISMKQLADAYSSFANLGKFETSSIISKITKNNHEIIYQKHPSKTQAMSDSTAYLITDMLKSAATNGTAKRLKSLPFEIASKTGTVGMSNSSKNTSAINISYTPNHTIISCISGKNMPENINGGTFPTMLSKDVLNHIYTKKKPTNFTKPSSIENKSISKTNYEKNIISTTDNPSDITTEIFSKTNLPSPSHSSLDLKLEVFNFKNKKPILCLFTSPNYTYKFIRKEKDKDTVLVNIDNLDNANFTKFEDKTAENDEIYEYFAEICEKSTNQTFHTNTIKLKTFS